MMSDPQAQPRQPVDVLLVEDNPLDARALKSTAQKLDVAGRIHSVTSGQDALDLLQGRAKNGERPDEDGPPPGFTPGLVLLDLNLPGKNGHDVLTEIRSDPTLRTLPVVILTTSDDSQDVATSYTLGANAYVNKPRDLDGWRRVVATINDFWLSAATLPR